MNMGSLFIVSAPSGAGKTSLVKALLERDPDLVVSVSHTTRPSRPGERDGVDYHFVSQQAFDGMLERGAFLEQAKVFDYSYGTSRETVRAQLERGKDVILEIDWQGARQVRQAVDAVTSIFILPPSRQALDERLRGRGQDSEQVIQRRMRAAEAEMSHYEEFDYLVVNDDFEVAVRQLLTIFEASRLRRPSQALRLKKQLNELLSGQDEVHRV